MPEASSLDRFVAVLETAFTRLRGREHVLSPRDFALARAWHAAGWPVAWVLAEVERSAARGERPGSLEFLRRRVEARAARAAVVDGVPAPAHDDGAPREPPTDATLAWVDALRAWLAPRAEHPACMSLAPLLARLDAATDDAARQETVAALERALDDAALELCGPAEAAAFRQEAARAAARQRGRLDDDVLEAALRRYETRRAREALGVPERG